MKFPNIQKQREQCNKPSNTHHPASIIIIMLPALFHLFSHTYIHRHTHATLLVGSNTSWQMRTLYIILPMTIQSGFYQRSRITQMGVVIGTGSHAIVGSCLSTRTNRLQIQVQMIQIYRGRGRGRDRGRHRGRRRRRRRGRRRGRGRELLTQLWRLRSQSHDYHLQAGGPGKPVVYFSLSLNLGLVVLSSDLNLEA